MDAVKGTKVKTNLKPGGVEVDIPAGMIYLYSHGMAVYSCGYPLCIVSCF